MERPREQGAGARPGMSIGAVLLAAGAGARLGGRPKSLLELDGVPLVRRQLVALAGAGVEHVVVVLGHHAERVAGAVRGFPVTLARNPSPDDGQAASLRVGLRALSGGIDGVIVALADQPLVETQDLVDLLGAFERRGEAAMVVPRVAGEPGNPVVIEAALYELWLAGEVDETGRRWRDANPRRVRWFDTGNTRYRVDIDTPEDLRRFAQSTGRVLRWPAAGGSG